MDMLAKAFTTENLILVMKKLSSMENKSFSCKSHASFPTKNDIIVCVCAKSAIEEQNTIEMLPEIFDENRFELVDGLIQLVPQINQTNFNK